MAIYTTPPKDFHPKFHATGVYVEHDGKILLLRRHPAKPEGGTWCLPGGKVQEGETPAQAVARETLEETGIKIAHPDAKGTFYVIYPTYAFVYHVFRYVATQLPVIHLKNDEHTASCWSSPKDALALQLIEDEDAVIERVYGIKRSSSTPDATERGEYTSRF